MLRVAICDDFIEICNIIESFIVNYRLNKGVNIEVDIFYSGEKLISALKNEEYYNLIFLDIELKDISGIQVGRYIRENLSNYDTKIVYISAEKKHAMNLFRIQPMDFLIKPIFEEDVNRILDLTIQLRNQTNDIFTFKSGRITISIIVKKIIYFESSGRVIKMVCDDELYTFYHKLDEVEKELLNSNFLRIHRSYLVNFDHINSISHDHVVMSNGQVLPISKQKRNDITKQHSQIARKIVGRL